MDIVSPLSTHGGGLEIRCIVMIQQEEAGLEEPTLYDIFRLDDPLRAKVK